MFEAVSRSKVSCCPPLAGAPMRDEYQRVTICMSECMLYERQENSRGTEN